MKKYLSLLFPLLLCLSCHIGKRSPQLETHQLQLVLDPSAIPQELVQEFRPLGLEKLARSSKSRPQYATVVNLSKKEFQALMEKLRADQRVVSIKTQDETLGTTQSTNSSFGKSRPKKKNP